MVQINAAKHDLNDYDMYCITACLNRIIFMFIRDDLVGKIR